MNYSIIYKTEFNNGKGVGQSLFVSGCPFHCYNCFNPEAWDFNYGNQFTEEIKKEFIELVKRPYIDRVSILGGEPLADQNIKDIYHLVKEIKENYSDKSIWVYTGYIFEDILSDNNKYRRSILDNIDILVDGQYIDSLHKDSLFFRGSTNQRIIKVQDSINSHDIKLLEVI